LRVVEQAGGIVFKRGRSKTSILLVRAKRDPSKWIFPKGHVEDGESLAETALRETHEEAGVVGEAIGPVAEPLEFDYRERRYRVQYFLIRLITETDETDGREKKWFSLEDALEHVSFDGARAILREARRLVEASPASRPAE
jgi:8-oxo-dGTP pyrophosphatase MutT (NUDIX family)